MTGLGCGRGLIVPLAGCAAWDEQSRPIPGHSEQERARSRACVHPCRPNCGPIRAPQHERIYGRGGEARGEPLVQVRGSLVRSSAGSLEKSRMPGDGARAGAPARRPTGLRSDHCGCGAEGIGKESGAGIYFWIDCWCARGAPLRIPAALAAAWEDCGRALLRGWQRVRMDVASTGLAARRCSESFIRRCGGRFASCADVYTAVHIFKSQIPKRLHGRVNGCRAGLESSLLVLGPLQPEGVGVELREVEPEQQPRQVWRLRERHCFRTTRLALRRCCQARPKRLCHNAVW